MATWKPKKLAGQLHRHGCDQCGQRYDDNCDIPEENGRCRQCRGVPHPPPAWERSYAPQECCRRLSRLATNDERDRYKLAGPGPWWICRPYPKKGCARTFPYDPTLTKETLP